MKLAGPSQYSN